MKKILFNVAFLSDIVLQATSNTEGNVEQLDFIPGSNFLGMVAKEYDEFEDSFNLFHSGAVRFGDATMVHNRELSYKMPLSFFHEKLEPKKLYNHHLIDDFKEFKQLKQKRKGYITPSLTEVTIKPNYSQKSAYDKESRRSKDSSMYGYYALPSGTQWQFTLSYDENLISNEDIAKVESLLIGKKRLGKSKSAQYGLVEISKATDRAKEVESTESQEGLTLLYAKSRLALMDEEGQPTYDLQYLLKDLESSQIVWEKSQLRTSTFSPFNGAMKTKSYERVVINSGSVIVLKNLTSSQKEQLQRGVGQYLSEGFGELLLNPSFLTIKEPIELNKISKGNKKRTKVEPTTRTAKFLSERAKAKEQTLNLADSVTTFINDNRKLYENISKSQWGTIRSICTSGSKKFREEIRDYISDGKVTWNVEQIETLLEENRSLAFIALVSMEMPKLKGEK